MGLLEVIKPPWQKSLSKERVYSLVEYNSIGASGRIINLGRVQVPQIKDPTAMEQEPTPQRVVGVGMVRVAQRKRGNTQLI